VSYVFLQYLVPSIHIPVVRENNFTRFQVKYLCVFYTVMFADWMQGVTMYDLYNEYARADKRRYLRDTIRAIRERENSTATASLEKAWSDGTTHYLFLTGFITSAIVSLFIGQYIDAYGRKKSCVAYCALEVIINVLEHIPNPLALYIGRVLGGVSTSILFVSFESWMVTEHRRMGFHDRLLKYTFSLAHMGNGIVAMVAGIVAQILKDRYGNIGPFRCAIFISAAMMLYIHFYWRENFGRANLDFRMACRSIFADRSLVYLGLIQALFESVVFTFVFNWVPALKTEWTGIVFSCFMVCIAIGSVLFQLFVVSYRIPSQRFGVPILGLASMALAIVARCRGEFATTLAGFLIFEVCIGATMANQSSLRSETIPQESQATIMNLLRVPLNVLTAVGIWGSSKYAMSTTLYGCATCLAISALVHTRLHKSQLNKLP